MKWAPYWPEIHKLNGNIYRNCRKIWIHKHQCIGCIGKSKQLQPPTFQVLSLREGTLLEINISPQKMAFWVDDFSNFPTVGYVKNPWRVILSSRNSKRHFRVFFLQGTSWQSKLRPRPGGALLFRQASTSLWFFLFYNSLNMAEIDYQMRRPEIDKHHNHQES